MGEEGLDSTSALRVAIILSIYFIFISVPSGKTVEMFLPNTFTLLYLRYYILFYGRNAKQINSLITRFGLVLSQSE
jgi:hypothetical protein